MSKGVEMIVTKQIGGRHDPRILRGSDPINGFFWEGGEEIAVTDELAANYEKSGIARRAEEIRETAIISAPETAAVQDGSKKRAARRVTVQG